MTASDLISHVSISAVFCALGGEVPRHGRACAFWRKGDGLNVSLSDDKGCWHHFPTDEGGGVLDLIVRAKGGSRKDALGWLANFAGVKLDDAPMTQAEKRALAKRRAADIADLRQARLFANAAAIMAEQTLEDLGPCDLQRAPLTRLLATLRTDAGKLATFRKWRTDRPRTAAALVRAGAKHQERLEMLLRNFLMQERDHAA
jgi:hypothetical protein